ncbi:MAG: hypothetical protein ACX936_21325, partial [Marinobacter sp.]
VEYQKNMGSVDRTDQMRAHGGGFSAHAHFKKWYKKVYLAVLDLMLINSWLAWERSVVMEAGTRQKLRMSRYDFYMFVAETMMRFTPQSAVAWRNRVYKQAGGVAMVSRPVDSSHTEASTISFSTSQSNTGWDNNHKRSYAVAFGGHVPVELQFGSKRRCVVCRLESVYLKEEETTVSDGKSHHERGNYRKVCKCAQCGVCAHSHIPDGRYRRVIHDLDEFKGLTCFDIVHSPEGTSIWPRNMDGVHQTKRYNVVREHPVVQRIKEIYGERKVANTNN